MLTMLFLLFSLSISSLTSGAKEEVKSTEAYRYRIEIPEYSPINLQELQRISSDYGIRKHPIYRKLLIHKGIDFVAPLGTSINSTADGVIESITLSDHGYGNQVIIRHSDTFKTRYAHLKNVCVTENQKVLLGDKIGELGNSGSSTGPHLHYEILENGTAIDPMSFSYENIEERSKQIYYNHLIALENS